MDSNIGSLEPKRFGSLFFRMLVPSEWQASEAGARFSPLCRESLPSKTETWAMTNAGQNSRIAEWNRVTRKPGKFMQNPLRNLPSVNQLLESEPLKKMVQTVNHSVVANGVRTFLDDLRTTVSSATEDVTIPTPQEIAEKIADWLESEEQPVLRPVINGTGVILHTGLGRAPLAESAAQAVVELSTGYSSVEIELSTGERGQRIRAVEKLLCELTGAEAACIVNNNAAATMITLATLAGGKEAIVSRGQLIEIGGSYRLPDVMECSGAKLREVGTTNKTHLSDYENAIGEETGILLKVHPSNFEVVGFTKTVSLQELVKIGRQHGVPVVDDVGSGALLDFEKYGLKNEPVVADSIAAGADVILFSGDKLVGGPQCGIIIGKKKFVEQIIRNPLMRAMRVGKMTLAALKETLLQYRNTELAEQNIPILRMLSMPLDNLKLRANKIAGQINHLPFIKTATSEPCQSMLGGGSLPTEKIESWCVAIEPDGISVDELAQRLRNAEPGVLGRVHREQLLLDFRTIEPKYDIALVEQFQAIRSGA